MLKVARRAGLRASLFVVLGVSLVAVPARASSEYGMWTAGFGPYTAHLSTDEKFNEFPWLMGLEWEASNHWGAGAAYFRNSFNQPCGYLYAQKRFVWGGGDEGWFLKIPLGLLYGYKPPHEHAVPFNFGGFSPGFAPIVGYKYGRFTAEAVIFGSLSGAIVVFAYDIWK